MKLAVVETSLRLHNVHTRMPFRYGIAAMTALPHLFLQITLDLDGRLQTGVAADHLPPKWFTKDPHTTFQHDVEEMLTVIQAACAAAPGIGPVPSVFDFWLALYQAQQEWGQARNLPPLLWGFGVSLVERAVIDAFCRARGTPFARALVRNELGLRLDALHPELSGRQPADFLPPSPLTHMVARHTVGLSDPLTDAEIPTDQMLGDGLPQSLVASIRAYGLTHFKLKIGGRIEEDLERLREIAAVVRGHCPAYFLTVDGNESYPSVAAFRELWERVMADPQTGDFVSRGLIFVEQPLHRDVALSEPVGEALAAWPQRPPILIDESDAQIESLPIALDRGYVGTSHKNCKGIFKGIANTCLIRSRAAQRPTWPYRISGEDLSNIGPVALLQDLAVLAALGIDHAERNGHHYFAGLGFLPRQLQERMAAGHGDLYRRHGATVAVRVTAGRVAVESLNRAPFGYGFDLDLSPFLPVERWRFESLGWDGKG